MNKDELKKLLDNCKKLAKELDLAEEQVDKLIEMVRKNKRTDQDESNQNHSDLH